MTEDEISNEIKRRRTFAIISHPDAGKTTLTEKLLLFGGAIQMAGTVKGRKATRHATSDWMRLEQQRGISVTSSVMQFPFEDLRRPARHAGPGGFFGGPYRTLTAVDSALMVIDCAKGVEERTIKLMEVCRLRDTPIMTFVNKLDRDGRSPSSCWMRSSGPQDRMHARYLADRHGPGPARRLPPARGQDLCVRAGGEGPRRDPRDHRRLASAEAKSLLGDRYADFLEEVDLVRGASPLSISIATSRRSRRRCSSARRSTTSACASC